MREATLAVVVGNRNSFPNRLIAEGRKDILADLKEMGIQAIVSSKDDTKLGAVETWAGAKRLAVRRDSARSVRAVPWLVHDASSWVIAEFGAPVAYPLVGVG